MLVTEEGFTDELLQQHTQEAENLSTKFETMKHILEVKCQDSKEMEDRPPCAPQKVVETDDDHRAP